MKGPLAGKTVLVTRPRRQAAKFVSGLEASGATVVTMPAIEIAEPDDFGPLHAALRALTSFDWLILTSTNGVDSVARQLSVLGIDPHLPAYLKLAAVGSATARAMTDRLRAPDVVPTEFAAEAIPRWLGDLTGKRVLLPQADLARRKLADDLRANGAEVTTAVAYRIVRARASEDLPERAPDYITLASSESARSTRDQLERQNRLDWLSTAAIVCIGPMTAATVRELGFAVAVVPDEYTVEGMLAGIIGHARREVARV